jgi:hypothetical protein
MTPVAEQTPAKTAPAKGVQVTDKALVKIRTAIVKEGIPSKAAAPGRRVAGARA